MTSSLKRFIALREEKIAKQVNEGDLLRQAEEARKLAERLSDEAQVHCYIAELRQRADDLDAAYQARVADCQRFWYGPDGLAWLAAKKNMSPTDWIAYAAFMDEAALKALAELIEQDLLRRYCR